jgi:hypothetical protein
LCAFSQHICSAHRRSAAEKIIRKWPGRSASEIEIQMRKDMEKQKVVNSYKYLDVLTTRMAKSWQKLSGEPGSIPWTEAQKPAADSTVALVSSAGLALKTDAPFDQQGEMENPWWGDPSFRVLPKDAEAEDITLYHLHINPGLVEQDLNTLFPIELLKELEKDRVIKKAAPRHYSYMGYLLQPQEMLKTSVPKMVEMMEADGVDAAILVPG